MSFHDQMAKGHKMTSLRHSTIKTNVRTHIALLGALFIGLTGCSGGGGNSVSNYTDPTVTGSTTAVSVSPEVAAFRDTVYNGKDANGRSIGVLRLHCSNCHVHGNITPAFADANVNTAYSQLISDGKSRTDKNGVPYADLSNPSASRMVTKVAGGHNCWPNGSNCDAAAAELANQIQAWADGKNGLSSGGGGTTSTTVNLIDTLAEPKVIQDPTTSKSLPDPSTNPDLSAFTTLHDLVNTRCIGCHVSTSATSQTPFFADPDINNSYKAIYDNLKIDINNPANSRLYLRLAQDSHNCWTTCPDNASEMLAAITKFADSIAAPAQFNPNNELVPSKALTMDQGQVVSGGVRYEGGLIAKYEFKEGSGAIAHDTSGIDPAADLTIADTTKVKWVSGWGLEFSNGGKALATIKNSQKLYDLIVSSGAYSVEAWVVPGNVTQGADNPAAIVTYSSGSSNRNFTLGQQLYNYTMATRISDANAMGETLTTPDAAEVLQATQQHVVVTYDTTNGRQVYVNGKLVSDPDNTTIGFIDQWDPNFVLTLGAESDGSHSWTGKIRMLAIYNSVLTPDEIKENFDAGVGQKFNLLFNVGQLHPDDDLPDNSYIWFTVSEFDNSSYLFSDPRFVILKPQTGWPTSDPLYTVDTTTDIATLTNAINLKGVRIGVNGKLDTVGQAFANVNIDNTQLQSMQSLVGTKQYDFNDGNGLVTLPATASDTIIAKQNGASGPSADQFFLAFKELDGYQDQTTSSTTIPALTYDYPTQDPLFSNGYVVGIRTFDELNATMAAVTGVNPATVQTTFDNLKQALPSKPDMKGFASALQMSIANLAGVYCNALVEDSGLRSTFFPGFDFTASVSTAFGGSGYTSQKQLIVDALTNKVVGNTAAYPLNIQPTNTDVKTALFGSDGNGGLYADLAANCSATSCTDAVRTRTIVKGMCMAVLGSAAVSQK